VFLLASVLMLGNSLIKQPGATLLDFGLIIVGIPVYMIWTRLRAPKNG